MKSFVLLSSALILLSVYCITSTEGLQCYFCGYAEGIEFEDGENIDISCRNGNEPNATLRETCSPSFNSCATLFYEGSIGGGDVKITIRGYLSEPDEKCDSGTAAALIADPTTPVDIRASLIGLPSSFNASYCTCKEDDCNSDSV